MVENIKNVEMIPTNILNIRNSLTEVFLRKISIFLVLLIFFPKLSFSENLVLNGTPVTKVSSSFEDTHRIILSESEQNEFRLLITSKDGTYYWASRGNRELILKISGAIYIFLDPMGGGYIEILDTKIVPEFSQANGKRFLYKEHLRNFLTNITYWGYTNDFNP